MTILMKLTKWPWNNLNIFPATYKQRGLTLFQHFPAFFYKCDHSAINLTTLRPFFNHVQSNWTMFLRFLTSLLWHTFTTFPLLPFFQCDRDVTQHEHFPAFFLTTWSWRNLTSRLLRYGLVWLRFATLSPSSFLTTWRNLTRIFLATWPRCEMGYDCTD